MMIQEYYSVEEIAQRLKLSKRQVERLADRDKLQGYQRQGQLVFSADSLIAYLEQGLKEKEETRLDEFMGTASFSEDPDSFSILDFLSLDTVMVPFRARTFSAVFQDMTARAAELGKLWDPKKMSEALAEREKSSSTALENGVALLHPFRPLTDTFGETFLMLGIAPSPIPFNGGHGVLTDIFFLICSENREIHLNIMMALGRLIREPSFIEELRLQETPEDVWHLIVKYEEKCRKE